LTVPWLSRSVVVATALVGAVPVLLLAVVTAWLLSNGSDIEPRARPAVLQLPAPTLPDERNAFFALTGLSAEAGRDPAEVGRALWQVNLSRAALSPPWRFGTQAWDELNRQEEAATGVRLPTVSGAPLYCKDAATGCVAEWLAEPAALAAQRTRMALWGARCDALLAPGMDFEERLPTPANFIAIVAPHGSGALQCSNWWRSGAVLAWQQGQPQQSLALLQRAARLDAALLAGSHSLVANMVAANIARNTQATVVGLAVVDASLALQLAALLLPVPESAQVAAGKRWIAYEAAGQQTAMADLAECADPALAPVQQPLGWAERQIETFERWQCRNRVGFLPERTRALSDDFWVGARTALDSGLQAAIEHLEAQSALAEQRGWQWQNTMGHMLLDVASPAYGHYFRQAADLPLHSEAAALALAAAAQRVPAAERAVWAQRQPVSDTLRQRLLWDASGQGFTVRTWTEEAKTPIEPRRAIRFAWPALPQG